MVTGIVSSILATLAIALGASVLTWIKRKWPSKGPLVLYWLASATCLTVLLVATTGFVPFAKPKPPETNIDNVESRVKEWAEIVGFAYAKTTMPDTAFACTITTGNGVPVQVFRSTLQKTGYIQFMTTMNAPSDVTTLIAPMSHDQLDWLTKEMSAELDKQKIGFSIATASVPQPGGVSIGQLIVVVQKGLPVADLTQSAFADTMDDLNFASQFVSTETALLVRKITGGREVSATTKSAK